MIQMIVIAIVLGVLSYAGIQRINIMYDVLMLDLPE